MCFYNLFIFGSFYNYHYWDVFISLSMGWYECVSFFYFVY